jgi:hypothetical protein
MSATSYTRAETRSNPWLLKLIVAALIVFAAFKLLPLVFGNTSVEVAYSEHAALHTEADAIRCSDNVLAVFVNKSCERFNVIKELPDGRVGDHVLQPCKRFGMKTLLEVTAYVINGGTLEEAVSVLTAKGCTQVWP